MWCEERRCVQSLCHVSWMFREQICNVIQDHCVLTLFIKLLSCDSLFFPHITGESVNGIWLVTVKCQDFFFGTFLATYPTFMLNSSQKIKITGVFKCNNHVNFFFTVIKICHFFQCFFLFHLSRMTIIFLTIFMANFLLNKCRYST